MSTRFIQIVITTIAVLMALVHTYFPEIKIDGITVTLLLVAILPWLAPLFRSVELPGGLKVEFQDLEAAKKKVEEAGLLKESGQSDTDIHHVYAFQAVAGNDPNLALAGLRIEIESRIRELAKNRGIQSERVPLRKLTHELIRKGALNSEEVSAIEDLLPLLNSAAHGAGVDDRASEWALEFGPRLLDELEDRLGETSIPRIVESWKSCDGAAVAEIGSELSKSLAQAPKAFFQAMKTDPESFESWLEGLPQHTFTIYESQSKLDDDLYMAYYEKLKGLMIKATKSLLNSEFNTEAERVLQSLESVEVSRVW